LSEKPIDLERARAERGAARARFRGVQTVRVDARFRAQLAALREVVGDLADEALIRFALGHTLGAAALLEAEGDAPALEALRSAARAYEGPAGGSE
jgi:hypothetical protein